MNSKIATTFFSLLCVVMMGGLIYVALQSRPEISVISGEAVISYKGFSYKLRPGETFLGTLGDTELHARIRLPDGSIRLDKPLERQ